jgi:hypothetical protein
MLAADKPPLEEVYLEHFGIKGMRWGVRKAEDKGQGQQHASLSQNQHRAVKAAAITGGVLLAAVLLKRGGVSVVNARSAKIYLSGAKASGRILGKVGKTLIKTSAKTATTVGKGSAKGAFKVGTLIGKGAAKGSVAGVKGAAKGTAQGGAKFYNNVLKKSYHSTVKLGSHAMFKFTGRGQPIVEEASKSGALRQLNPVDLLLNTRADTLRGGRR